MKQNVKKKIPSDRKALSKDGRACCPSAPHKVMNTG